MGFGFRLFQFIAASSRDNFFLMFQIVVKNLLQVEDAGMPVDEGQHLERDKIEADYKDVQETIAYLRDLLFAIKIVLIA